MFVVDVNTVDWVSSTAIKENKRKRGISYVGTTILVLDEVIPENVNVATVLKVTND